jgi:hypothetical protein
MNLQELEKRRDLLQEIAELERQVGPWSIEELEQRRDLLQEIAELESA